MAYNKAKAKKLGGHLGTGAGAGVARSLGAGIFGPTFGAPLGEAAVGWFAENDTAMYMAGRDLGTQLASGLGGVIGEVLG